MLMSKSPGGILPDVKRDFMGGDFPFFALRECLYGERRQKKSRIKAFVGIVSRNLGL